MYSRKKGKSGSKRPSKKTRPTWIRYKQKEVEILITKLAKEGHSPSQIGLILRDRYGIPDVRPILESRITKVLAKKNLTKQLPEDMLSLIKKYIAIKEHLEENKQDQVAHRGLKITTSKIGKLTKYYKRSRKLPQDWFIDETQAKLYVQ